MRRDLFCFFRSIGPRFRLALKWLALIALTVSLVPASTGSDDLPVCTIQSASDATMQRGTDATSSPIRPCSHHARWGEYGGNLNLLRGFYTPPQTPGESNYFIDVQQDKSFRSFAVAHGLTNNHALFVLSHGRAIQTDCGPRYAFYARKNDRGDTPTASFSIQDIARLLGPVNAGKIHNLVLAGCNRENMLCPPEVRSYFPNVTNLTYALPGTDARLSSFYHALTYHSRDIDFLYEMPDTFTLGVFEQKKASSRAAKKRVPYVADLYLPGAKRPFLRQTAGRELLQPAEPQPKK